MGAFRGAAVGQSPKAAGVRKLDAREAFNRKRGERWQPNPAALLRLPAVGDNAGMIDPQPNRFSKGDRVRINNGTFQDFVGVFAESNEVDGRVVVVIQVPGACGSTPVELERWQIEPA
jgi:transcription antitermination factor NusG